VGANLPEIMRTDYFLNQIPTGLHSPTELVHEMSGAETPQTG